MSPLINPHYDALIVGARCAGAATAMLLARRGLRVLVIERGRYGTDTLSTHALMRGGVLQLHRWGLLPRIQASGTPAILSTTFHYGDERITVPIKERDGVDALYAPRRTVLDRVLVDAAVEAGARVLFGVRLRDLTRAADGRVTGATVLDHDTRELHTITADTVIGADGMFSTTATLVNAATVLTGPHAAGVVYAHWNDIALDGYHWHFVPGVSAGGVATTKGQACIFAAVPASRFQENFGTDMAGGYHRLLRIAAPELADLIAEARMDGSFQSVGGHAGFLRRACGPGWALVGDAGYFKDPATAHGITDALRDAELLADAVASGTDSALRQYEIARDEFVHPLFDITDQIASFDWDLTSVRPLHEELARAMSQEVKAMVARFGSSGGQVLPFAPAREPALTR